jgi:transposase
MECCIRWPPQSPDLNPIEMLWDELDRRAFQVKLVERIPRVCKAVIKAKSCYFEEYQIYLFV